MEYHPPDCKNVGARLSEFSTKCSNAPRWTRTVVKKGHSWKWLKDPPPITVPSFKNKCPHLDHFVSKLLLQNAIQKVKLQPCYVLNIFVVLKALVRSRMILNLSSLNTFTRKITLKMTNHSSLRKILPQRACMVTLDIRNAFLHIPIKPSLRKYLAFPHGLDLFFLSNALRCKPGPIHLFQNTGISSKSSAEKGCSNPRLFRQSNSLGSFFLGSENPFRSDHKNDDLVGFHYQLVKIRRFIRVNRLHG